MSTASGQVLDQYLHTQYEVIRLVHDNLDAIRAVASHLTPVEDLVDFQEEVTALHAKLGVLTTASELILSATPSGIALLTAANAAAQRQLLELGSAAMREEEYFATAAGLAAAEAAIAAANTQINAILVELATKASKAELDALAAELALIDPRLDLIELVLAEHSTKLDLLDDQIGNLTAIDVDVDSRLTSITDQIVGQGTAITGLTSRVESNEDGASIMVGRVTVLETNLVDLETGAAASSTAIQNLQTQTSMFDGVIATHSTDITALASRLDNAEGELDATSLALQDLTTTVLQNGALLTTTSDFTTQLASRLTDAETGLEMTSDAMASLTTEVTQLGDSLVINSEDIVALKAEVGSVGNLAPNAGFEGDTHGWSIFNRGSGWTTVQLGRNEDAAVMLPLAMNALSVATATQPTGKLGIKSDNLPTTGGQRYILSGWLASVNCEATLEWRLLNQAGEIIQLGLVGNARAGGTTNINDWPRLWGEIPANADARELQIQVWIQSVTAPNPKLWLLRPMLEEVSGLQDGPSRWVPGVTGLAKATAEAVSTLTARVEGVEGDLTSIASQVTDLNVNMGTVQSALISEMIIRANQNGSMATSINGLSAQMNDPVTGLEAQGNAVESLSTEVSTLNGVVTSQGSSLTSLQSQVDAMDADTGGYGSAISALDTRVTVTENDIESLSTSVTALESSVTSANKIFAQPSPPSTVGRTVGDLWIDTDDGNKIYSLVSTQGVNSWVPRPSSKNKVFVQPTQPTAENVGDMWVETDNGNKMWLWNGTTWVDGTDNRVIAHGSAITSLETRTTSIEGVNTSQGSAITALQNTVNNPSSGVTATAGAVTTLQTRVTAVEGVNSSQASAITNVTSRVSSAEGNITNQASATSALTTRVTQVEGQAASMEAKWTVNLDVNGYISGITSVNNGATSEFQVRASKFALVNPAGGAGMTWNQGTLWNRGANHSVLLGQDLGVTNDILLWVGANPANADVIDKNAALFYVDNAGNAGFSGSLKASTFDMRSTTIRTGGGREAPFIIYDCANAGSSTGQTTLYLNFVTLYSPDYGAGFHGARLANRVMDVMLFVTASGYHPTSATTNIHLEAQYDGGAWERFATNVFDVGANACESLSMRYTTKNTAWSTVKFRAICGGLCHATSGFIQVFNFSPSSYLPGSTSNPDTGEPGGGNGTGGTGTGGNGTGGGGGWCVVARSYLSPTRQAESARPGDVYRTFSPEQGIVRRGIVAVGHFIQVPCVRLTTSSGAQLECSTTTPFNLRQAYVDLQDGLWKHAPDMLHEDVLVEADDYNDWEQVVRVEDIGLQWVIPISFGGHSFAAGVRADRRIYSHNMAKPLDPAP